MIQSAVTLIWASKEHYKIATPDIEHIHSDIFHFVYIVSGHAKVLVDSQMVETPPNTLYMTRPGMPQNYIALDSTGLFTIEFKFMMKHSAYTDQLTQVQNRLYKCSSYVQSLIQSIISEGIYKKPFYEQIANMRLCELILILIRDINLEKKDMQPDKLDSFFDSVVYDQDNATQENESKQILSKLVLYIHEYMSRELTLDQMAAHINLSKGHLIELFKKEYGMTPIKYLNKIRIARAKELLKASSYNINEIAELTGFMDARYFSRVFKKNVNQTPSEYIDQYRDNVYLHFFHGYENG